MERNVLMIYSVIRLEVKFLSTISPTSLEFRLKAPKKSLEYFFRAGIRFNFNGYVFDPSIKLK